MIKDNTVLERLAALEHDQWVTWAQEILNNENISGDRGDRWAKFFIPYEDLPEEVKEHDRVLARKVLEVINA